MYTVDMLAEYFRGPVKKSEPEKITDSIKGVKKLEDLHSKTVSERVRSTEEADIKGIKKEEGAHSKTVVKQIRRKSRLKVLKKTDLPHYKSDRPTVRKYLLKRWQRT